MIAKIDYSVLKSLTAQYDASKMTLSATIEGYPVKECPLMLVCTSMEFTDAVKTFSSNTNIVGYMITDGVDFVKLKIDLQGVSNKLNVLIVYKYLSEDTTALEQALTYIQSNETLCKHVNVLVKLPDDYTNMMFVKQMCDKYTNVRFTGGTLLALCGCKIGAIENEDLPKKIADSKIPVIYEGDQSVDLVVPYLEMIEITWANKGSKVVKPKTVTVDSEDDAIVKEKKTKTPKTPKEPKEVKPTKKSVIASKFAVADDDEF